MNIIQKNIKMKNLRKFNKMNHIIIQNQHKIIKIKINPKYKY